MFVSLIVNFLFYIPLGISRKPANNPYQGASAPPANNHGKVTKYIAI